MKGGGVKPDFAAGSRAADEARRVNRADRLLERIYVIAQDMAEGRAKDIRRQGRRIMEAIDSVDDALGLDGEDK